jgi:glycosyltransferase involved in cell wall biosynthesis
MSGNGHSKETICILPRLEGLGGPASFRARLVTGLARRGIRVHQDPRDPTCRALLVIGGTSRLNELLAARRRGLRLVQRLNGMNWIHRRRATGLRHFLKSEYNNFILALIRRWLAGRIVYQSGFARTWWQTVYGSVRAPARVIFNGVDLDQFHPSGPAERPLDRDRLLLVEGHLGGGNEMGLENAIALAQLLDGRSPRPVELAVVGDVPAALRLRMEDRAPGMVRWLGVLQRDAIPSADRSAHLLFSADLNAACPNSVVEALACGLPVVAFATGSLPELVQGSAGRVVPWGSNYWKLEPPDISALAEAALGILADSERFRLGARERAEEAFGLEEMVDKYVEALLG